MLNEYLSYLQEAIVLGANPKRAKDLPPKLLTFLFSNPKTSEIASNVKDLEGNHKNFYSNWPSLDCKNWDEYFETPYQCKATHKFMKDKELFAIYHDIGTNEWFYSFKDKYCYLWDHEMSTFMYLAITDRNYSKGSSYGGTYYKGKHPKQEVRLTVDEWMRYIRS